MTSAVTPAYTKTLNWREFACGWCAALINITITYPINKIIFRQMLHGVRAASAVRELQGEGFHYLYRGILPPLCQKTISLSIMFGAYEEVRRPLVDNGVNKYLAKTVGGLAAGSLEAILTPFERTQTLLQDSAYHNKFRNMYHAFRVISTNYGIKEFYRGLSPILARNGPSNVCFFIIRDEIQCRMPKTNKIVQKTLNEFLCGAMIGVILSSVFFPLNVIKVAMQSDLGGEYHSIFKVAAHIYRERGGKLHCMYHGFQVNGARAFISWGVMNTAYEHVKKLIY